MRYLILGCTGMAGHMIGLYLKEKGNDVVGFCRKPCAFLQYYMGDAANTSELKRIIKDGKFDYIVNCIGILNKDADKNKAEAILLNTYLPHYIVSITDNTPTKVIQISTDCVFSGSKGRYDTLSMPDGTTFYDRSKALGEINDDKNITLRMSIIGPDIDPNGIGLLNWFMHQKSKINGYSSSIWTGLSTLELAKTIEKVSCTNIHGLMHAVPKETISKLELLKLCNHYLRADSVKIEPVQGIVQDKSLLQSDNSVCSTIANYSTMIKEMADWINNHPNVYPSYYYNDK